MVSNRPKRKELRKRQATLGKLRQMKKGSALVGTALVGCSIAAPVVMMNTVEAAETDSSVTSSQLNHEAVINQLVKEVQPIAEQHGVATSEVVAQAIVDSNWGTKEYAQAPYYNLFGIEGKYNGNSVNMLKEDVVNGRTVQAAKELKAYDSYEAAIADYVQYFKTETDSSDAAVKAIINDYNLSRFDQAAPVTNVAQTASEETPQQYYTVETGDTVNSITNDFDIEKDDFVDWNNLEQQEVQPGQDVVVHESAAPEKAADVNLSLATAPSTTTVAHNDPTPAPVVETPAVEESTVAQPSVTPETTPSESTTVSESAAPAQSVQESTVPEKTEESSPLPAPAPEASTSTESSEVATPETSTQEAESTSSTQESQEVAQQPAATTPTEDTQVEENSQAEQPAETTPSTPETTPEQPAEVTPPVDDESTQESQTPEVTPPTTEEGQTQQPETTPPANENNQGNQTPETTPSETENGQNQTPSTPNNNGSEGQAIVDAAAQQVGKPYVWGAKGPDSFDCSGLTQYVYQQVTGQNIGNWTVAQEQSGTQIAVDQAQAGDLYFWGSQGASYHVAIATGGGQYIHAPQPGQNVTYGSTQYYSPDFAMQMNY